MRIRGLRVIPPLRAAMFGGLPFEKDSSLLTSKA